MIIDLITLKNSPFAFDYSFSPAEIDLDSGEAKLKNEVKVKGVLTKRIAQTDVEGEVFAPLEIECTRCLQNINKDLEVKFNVAFVAPENFTEAREAELNATDLDVAMFEGDKVDLTELVREQILLNLPEQVFCREDCKGLCEKCGANRNLIDCKCTEKEIDPRWSALENFNKS